MEIKYLWKKQQNTKFYNNINFNFYCFPMKIRLTHSQRLQIQYLRKKGKSYRSIARTIGCHQQTVKRWADKPLRNIEENKRSGRHTKTNKRKNR